MGIMKIGMSDSCGLKFSQDIKEYWEKKGHEVRYERGASEFIAQWADLYYMDWSDNNIHYLFNIYSGNNPEHPDGTTYKKPIFAVRAIDIDIWSGGARDQRLVDFVDKWICIAPHLEEKLRKEAQYKEGQLKLIRPGVNLEKFTLKTKQTDGFQLGMVLGDMWWMKNHMGGLDIFTSLYQKDNRWRLHIRGQHEPGEYYPVMYADYLKSRQISDVVTLYGEQKDMSNWYENIDILLHPGMKEGFCYAVGEAMAKGIPAVINNFYGAMDIWENDALYNTHEQAMDFIQKNKDTLHKYGMNDYPFLLRKYIEKEHNLQTMLKEYDEFLGT